MICTFYSFKGGVGRSMALANVAEYLYARGLKVLMVDFDLEAPGLEKFFDVPEKALVTPQEVVNRRGVIDMLLSYVKLRSLRRSDSASSREELSTPVEPLSEFVVRLYERNPQRGELAMIPAGRRDGGEYTDYAQRIRSFDWDEFFTNQEGEAFFEWFRRETESIADVVLIDSRTGFSEMSGVCTYQLADAVVMFVAPNRQNLDGTLMMAASLSSPDLIKVRGRPLSLLFVPSRIDNAEAEHLDEFAREFERSLNRVAPRERSLDGTSFNDLKLLYVPHYAYMERVAVREARPSAADLVKAYERIASALAQLNDEDGPLRRTFYPDVQPFEELVLELTDVRFHEQDGMPRASARAQLVYEPASREQPPVYSAQPWRFIAPIGPIEAEEMRWYLEKYAIWPSDYFRERARKVEASLVEWGRLLYEAALPPAHTANVMQAWARIDGHAGRRFSIEVDAAVEDGTPSQVETARESATLLLGLPWELLYDGDRFLFQGAKPMRVRRRIPTSRVLHVPIVTTPIRILLVTARPEDDACLYIDHRASALPLVEAMEALGGLVRLHVLDPPTLPALREELDRARRAGEPYHVLHFDGHGVYDRHAGLGGLCFEDPQDVGRLERRRHLTVHTDMLGPLLSDHHVPLVFLEACQTAQAEKASESVATELLKVGVASVVAMSHGVLVETARRFVEAFYDALARGNRVGDAMLAGQLTLKNDPFRGRIPGVGELRLEDWFVPVLYQQKDDPQLFRRTPSQQTREDVKTAIEARLGELPAEPETGFVGRSRDLLALQRLLRQEGNARYAVVRGQGGEGKTALAAEFARWMVRSQQIRRAAFVSVEAHSNLAAVLDAIGRQLVPDYSVATFEDLERAILPVERALAEQSTLLVMDNMESILLPPYLQTPEALSEEAREALDAILQLCRRLNAKGDTRIVFTSRETLPAPFDAERNRHELHQLDREDAVKLVERALNRTDAGAGAAFDAARESVEHLVEVVHGHARTLALLTPALRSRGADATRASLVELMADMERRFPGSREKSLFASVELSLRRMSPANRDRARVLSVFHGAVHLDVLRRMTEWESADVVSLAVELIETGLAAPNPYNHLTLNPALCPYLGGQTDTADRESLMIRWTEVMLEYAEFLREQQSRKSEVAATLTVLSLPNLFALLDHVQRAGGAEATIKLTTGLYSLLQLLGKPRLLERVAQARDAATLALAQTWNHAHFEAQRTRIEQQLSDGRLREAFDGAEELLRRARQAGETGYPNADYDLAIACFLVARVLKIAGGSEEALPLLDEAQGRFTAFEWDRPDRGAARMESACITERGDCLRDLGRLDEAAAAYKEAIRRYEHGGAERNVAVGKSQLGNVRVEQARYNEALEIYEEARERFTRLDEPGSVAAVWHQTGRVCQEAGQPEAAEDAYRKSLGIKVRLGDIAGQAATLVQLGNLYADILARPEEAVAFYQQAADKYVQLRAEANEGRTRTNLAMTLRKLDRFEEARYEVRRAIECKKSLGHGGSVWNAWSTLDEIETADGNPTAAAQAKRKAREHYLAYRRDGGENHNPEGRICLAVTQALLTGDVAASMSLLEQLADAPSLPEWLRPLIQCLQAISAGSRDPQLAEAPDLDYTMAAEILLLIETLERNTE
jgi:tetratricopeptide (TPR) repeat protein/Mrp family chromosome partitioning ATPase